MRTVYQTMQDLKLINKDLVDIASKLSTIQKITNVEPMQYTARLMWESLYNVQEALLYVQQFCEDSSENRCTKQSIPLSSKELGSLYQAIEQAMFHLRQIQSSNNISFMRKTAIECCKNLEKAFLYFHR